MREQDIERLAGTLGAARGRQVDPARVAERVVGRLGRGEQLARRPHRLARWGLAVAAVLTVMVATDGLRQPGDTVPVSFAAPVALSELDRDGLGEALDSLVLNAPASEFVGWGVGTMNADELETLLAAMEG